MAIILEGHALRDTESSHYKAHESMEQFWDTYRKDPTKTVNINDYNKALNQSLKYAGMSDINAAYATSKAVNQQKAANVGSTVTRVSGKMHQMRRKYL